MKPWEETWSVDGDDVFTGPAADCEWSGQIHNVSWGEGDCEARARLAAAAPEMARLLLELEWSGYVDYVGDGGYRCCPSCGGVCPEDADKYDALIDVHARGRTVLGHRGDCRWVAALRKAGIR